MKKFVFITSLFVSVVFLLWSDVRLKNQLPKNKIEAPGEIEISKEFRVNAVNPSVSGVSRFKHKNCLVSDEQAVAASEEFIHKIGLGFQSSPDVRDLSLSNIDYPGTRNLKDVTYYSNGSMRYRFYIGCESGAVENSENLAEWGKYRAASDMKEPYNLQKTFESLARQIGIPSDMHFDKVNKDWRNNIWIGEFIRTKDGYKYDLDNVAIGVSGKTGKFASYRKVYFGKSCPTEVKIQKDDAIKTASTEFHKFIFDEVRSHSNELYDQKVQLLIIQPERSTNALGAAQEANPPLKEKPSRLAWVVRYNFTGGIKYQKDSKPIEEMNPEERQNYGDRLSLIENLQWKYGNPVHSFEMRIDAGTGEVLYVSHKNPDYYYKNRNRRCK